MQTKLFYILVAKLPQKILSWILLFYIFFLSSPHASLAVFNDLPQDPFYKSYIESFEQANIIVGDTAGGKPIENLRPDDFIQRDEFTKVAVLITLLEEAQKMGNLSEYQNLDLDTFTLKISKLLKSYYKVINGAKTFSDVKQKEDSCASDPAGCQPWHTEYINYASSKGMINGYSDGTFKPTQPILRLHALKLIMTENGHLPAIQDVKFQKLSADPRIQKVNKPKCLSGAEALILANNGGKNPDAENLLSYAILADKLDLFGNHCQFFSQNSANTPQERANLLQEPITRKEIARYYSLTTEITSLASDPQTDQTTSNKEENGMNFYVEGERKDKEKVEDKEGKPFSVLNPTLKNTLEKQDEVIQKNNPPGDSSIQKLSSVTKEGRCCSLMSFSSCKKIQFKDYIISETPLFNYQTYQGGTWYEAKKGGMTCYIPFEDILGKNTNSSQDVMKVILVDQNLGAMQGPSASLAINSDRKLEIFNNLNSYLMSGHTLEDTRNYGLGGKKKDSEDYKIVLSWYQEALTINSTIYKNLNAYFINAHTLDEAKAWGLKGKLKTSLEYYFVTQWYNFYSQKQVQIIKNLTTQFSKTADLKGTYLWGIDGKNIYFPEFYFVKQWYQVELVKQKEEDEKLLNDEERGPEFWENEVWSPYDDWMTVSYKTGSEEREKGLIEFIKTNKQMFIDTANAPMVKGKVSPPLIAAIMWDEIVGNPDKEAQKGGSEGYSKYDFKDETNTFSFIEGHTYGPFQVSIATAVSTIEAGYSQKPLGYDTFFDKIDVKDAYKDNDGNPIKNNLGMYLTQSGKEKIEILLGKFSYSIQLAAGRMAQTVDYWNVAPYTTKNGGAILNYVDTILGTLYSKGLVGNYGVNSDPSPNPRGLGISNKSKEFNISIFASKYKQEKVIPIPGK